MKHIPKDVHAVWVYDNTEHPPYQWEDYRCQNGKCNRALTASDNNPRR